MTASVKAILDAVGSATMSQALIDFLLRNGVDLEWYHPLRWYTLNRFNHRTHRKTLIVDGTIGFSGRGDQGVQVAAAAAVSEVAGEDCESAETAAVSDRDAE